MLYPFNTGNLATRIEIDVTDITGKKYLIKNWNTGSNKTEIDLSDLPNGIYFIKIKFGERCAIKKIILEK